MNTKALGLGGRKWTSPYIAKDTSVRTSVTLWSIARLTTDHLFETTLTNARAMNGESTQSAKSTSRSREGLRRPAQSIKPTEPTAPTGTAMRAAARRRPRHPRSPATLAERPSLVRDSVFMSAMVELNFVSQSKLCQSQYRSMRRLSYGQQPPFYLER